MATTPGPAPAVSVITPLYQRSAWLRRAYASVAAQTRTDWELLLVQDGDQADVTAVAQALAAEDPRVRWLPRGRVGSIGEACNHALGEARGRFVAILDDDDTWADDGKLAAQVRFLEEHPDHVGCGGAYRTCNAAGTVVGVHRKPRTDDDIRRAALLANPMANSTTLFRREAALAAGGYSDYVRDFQDWDFWLKLLRQGKLHNVDDVLLNYTLWEGGSSFRNLRSNADCARRIIHRHRDAFPGYPRAWLFYLAYQAYSRLPPFLSRAAYQTLSRWKKRWSASAR